MSCHIHLHLLAYSSKNSGNLVHPIPLVTMYRHTVPLGKWAIIFLCHSPKFEILSAHDISVNLLSFIAVDNMSDSQKHSNTILLVSEIKRSPLAEKCRTKMSQSLTSSSQPQQHSENCLTLQIDILYVTAFFCQRATTTAPFKEGFLRNHFCCTFGLAPIQKDEYSVWIVSHLFMLLL